MDSRPLESAIRIASEGVITAHLDAASLGRIRLAASPVFETLSWLELTTNGERHPVFGDPGSSARYALRDPDVALLAQVVPASTARFTPDFLTPKAPAGRSVRAFASQLDVIRNTPDLQVVAEVEGDLFAGTGVPGTVRRAMDSGTLARRAANGLRTFWRHAVADQWASLSSVLENDVSQRSEQMSTHGVGAVLRSLHPRMHWDGGQIRIDSSWNKCLEYVDAELVLTPSAFAWPRMLYQLGRPEDASVYYPATGVGAAVGSRLAHGMPKLMGATRARLLRDLLQPRSTSELSARHGLAPATVSYHLGVLRGAGLVLRARERRVVLYRCSEQARSLLGATAALR